MAGRDDTAVDRAEALHGPRECMPCRGTGRVLSNLDGSPKDLTCPWCRGEGVRLAGVDAQARWLEQADDGQRARGDPFEPAKP